MKKLFIIRHAKAVIGDPDNDFERVLNDKGRADSLNLAAYLCENYSSPDLLVCSAAFRTKETADIIIKANSWEFDQKYTRKLYLASASQILKELSEIDDDYNKLMLVGHNNGIHDFAMRMCANDDDENFVRLTNKFPTCSFAAYVLPIKSWKNIEFTIGQLTDFRVPSGSKE